MQRHSYDLYVTVVRAYGITPAGYQRRVGSPRAEVTAIHRRTGIQHITHKAKRGRETKFVEERESFAIPDFFIEPGSHDQIEFYVNDADNYHSTYHKHKRNVGFGVLTGDMISEIRCPGGAIGGCWEPCPDCCVPPAPCKPPTEWVGICEICLEKPGVGETRHRVDRNRGTLVVRVRIVDRGEVLPPIYYY